MLKGTGGEQKTGEAGAEQRDETITIRGRQMRKLGPDLLNILSPGFVRYFKRLQRCVHSRRPQAALPNLAFSRAAFVCSGTAYPEQRLHDASVENFRGLHKDLGQTLGPAAKRSSRLTVPPTFRLPPAKARPFQEH